MVNVEHIRARLQGQFRPFTVVTFSGHKYPVPHPDYLFLTPRTVIVADAQGYTASLDPLHMVSLEDIHGNRTRKQRQKR